MSGTDKQIIIEALGGGPVQVGTAAPERSLFMLMVIRWVSSLGSPLQCDVVSSLTCKTPPFT